MVKNREFEFFESLLDNYREFSCCGFTWSSFLLLLLALGSYVYFSVLCVVE